MSDNENILYVPNEFEISNNKLHYKFSQSSDIPLESLF